MNLCSLSCTLENPKGALKKWAVKTEWKEKNLVFNESKIFSHIKVYQQQSFKNSKYQKSVALSYHYDLI